MASLMRMHYFLIKMALQLRMWGQCKDGCAPFDLHDSHMK